MIVHVLVFFFSFEGEGEGGSCSCSIHSGLLFIVCRCCASASAIYIYIAKPTTKPKPLILSPESPPLPPSREQCYWPCYFNLGNAVCLSFFDECLPFLWDPPFLVFRREGEAEALLFLDGDPDLVSLRMGDFFS
jgi:hypothetical protein